MNSAPICTQQAVLAGCQFATLCLQMVVLAPLDAVQAAFPRQTAEEVQLGVVVDDFALHKVGSEDRVHQCLDRATTMLHHELQAAHLPVSRPKSRLLASHVRLRRRLAS
eukprot:5855106-Pyramimonas_sp.AAC.1